jgi:indolepyruvate ferredoxin oxidoreductase alpha subunit
MCPGCPHRGLFYILNKLKLTVMGDIGCYTLGALPPLSAMDAVICMGASVSSLHGINIARGKEFAQKSVAVIGDSTFVHSGITGLIDIAYNKGVSTVIVLDNSTTGMTGQQDNPATGYTIKGEKTTAVDIPVIAKGCGFKRIAVIDPGDLALVERTVREELLAEEPSLIISMRPCVLLKTTKSAPPAFVDQNACIGCKLCMKVGCPAISINEHNGKKQAAIDNNRCVGCMVCAQLCKSGAIKEAE